MKLFSSAARAVRRIVRRKRHLRTGDHVWPFNPRHVAGMFKGTDTCPT